MTGAIDNRVHQRNLEALRDMELILLNEPWVAEPDTRNHIKPGSLEIFDLYVELLGILPTHMVPEKAKYDQAILLSGAYGSTIS